MAPVTSFEDGELEGARDGLGAVPVGRPRVGMEMSSVEHESGPGVFDSNVVVRQLRLRSSVVRRCHERELERNPGLQGRVVTRFTIQPSGAVSGVSTIENGTGSPAVADCVANVARTLRFNPGPEGGAVTYRFPVVYLVENAPSPPPAPLAGSTDPSAPDYPSRADVVAAMNAVTPAVRACGSRIGLVPVRIVFAGADGTVSSTTVSSSQGHAASLTACIEQAARGARLPPFRRASFTVNYPFRL
jgi:TonB family protein